MRKRFITEGNLVYWVELYRYIDDLPIYTAESGWYLGSYKFGDKVKHIVTTNITSCVVKHVDQYYTTEPAAKFAADERTCYASKRNN